MNNTNLKCCRRCGINKPISEFGNHKETKDRLKPYCKKCGTLYVVEYNLRNPEKHKEQGERYRIKNKTLIRNRVKAKRQREKFTYLCYSSNKRVAYKELITPQELWRLAKKQKLRCAISGIKLTNENISVDHIIPIADGGRNIISNLQLVDKFINDMKNSHSQEEFLEIVKKIYNYNFSRQH